MARDDAYRAVGCSGTFPRSVCPPRSAKASRSGSAWHRVHLRKSPPGRLAALRVLPMYARINYLYVHALSVEMAEAFAEYLHKRIRGELGFAAGKPATPRRCRPKATAAAAACSAIPPARTSPTRSSYWHIAGRRDRHHPLRRRPARPRAIHLGHRPPPPAGQILLRVRGSISGCRRRSEPPARTARRLQALHPKWPAARLHVAPVLDRPRHRPLVGDGERAS
jgi:hypothetical protein